MMFSVQKLLDIGCLHEELYDKRKKIWLDDTPDIIFEFMDECFVKLCESNVEVVENYAIAVKVAMEYFLAVEPLGMEYIRFRGRVRRELGVLEVAKALDTLLMPDESDCISHAIQRSRTYIKRLERRREELKARGERRIP